jgi:formamidopyrimidine-DNA glycosylase
MPELPDIEAYRVALEERFAGTPLERVRVASPFVVRTFDPPISDAAGRVLQGVRRIGKRIVLVLEDGRFLVIHLMIAGRLKLEEHGQRIPAKVGLAAFDFPAATVILTEASTQKRASIHYVVGEEALTAHDPGGLEPLDADPASFRAALVSERHTVKRALTDPRLLAGIGNAYSDEILHRARLSPFALTTSLSDEEHARLHGATQTLLGEWRDRLVAEAREKFPAKVTAFRDDFAVHGRYGKPCPVCGSPVQRIRYADNETNYCPTCQTGGRLLADRSLSRLLKDDFPRTLDELEALKRR